MSEVKYTEEEIEKIKDRILEALEMVIDPELGIDIVNLGLIYDIRFQQDGYTEIDMTLTTIDRKSTRLNSSHSGESRMPSSA